MEEVIVEFLRRSRLGAGHNTSLVFRAWDDVSGAAACTQKRFFRNGTLYITLSSSVVRSALYLQRDALIERINARLRDNPLFIKDNAAVGYVEKIVLK